MGCECHQVRTGCRLGEPWALTRRFLNEPSRSVEDLLVKQVHIRQLAPPQMLIVATVVLLPIAHSMAIARPYRTGQLAVLLIAGGCLLALAVTGSISWLRQEGSAVRWAVLSSAAFAAWLAFSSAMGLDPLRSLVGHQFQSTGLLFWLITLGLFVVALRWRASVAGAFVSGIIISSLVLLVFVAFSAAAPELVQEFLVPLSREGVPLPGFGNSAFLGAFLALSTVVTVGRSLQATGRWRGLVLLGGVLAAYLVTTQARISILAAAVCMIALFASAVRQKIDVRWVAACGVMVIAAGWIAQTSILPLLRAPVDAVGSDQPPADTDAPTRSSKFDPGAVEAGLGVRKVFWSVGARAFFDHPLTGYGPGNYSFAYRNNVTVPDLEKIGDPEREVQDAHNLFVEIAVTAGIPGLVLILFLFAAIFRSIVKGAPSSKEILAVRLGGLVLFVAHLFEPLSLALTPLLFITLAVSAGLDSSEDDQTDSPTPRDSGLFRRVTAGVAVAIGLLLAIDVMVSGYFLARGSLEWDRKDLETAFALDPTCSHCLTLLGKVRSWDVSREHAGTKEWGLAPYREVVRRHPNDSDAYLKLAGGMMFLDRPRAAAKQFGKARSLNPNSPLAVSALTAAYLRDHDYTNALRSAKVAVAIYPSQGTYSLLEEAARGLGRDDIADAAHAKAAAANS